MILEQENWFLGYSQILNDCRDYSKISGGTIGNALILCSLDVDAMSAARIISYMLRCDGIPYQLLPCNSYHHLQHIVCKSNHVADTCAIFLLNFGATRNLTKLLANRQQQTQQPQLFQPKVYVLDCRRPFHLANIHANDNIILFWDSTQNLEDIPSDGDNLSGTESSSDEDSSDDDDDDDDSDVSISEEDDDLNSEEEFEGNFDTENVADKGKSVILDQRNDDTDDTQPMDQGQDQDQDSKSFDDDESKIGKDNNSGRMDTTMDTTMDMTMDMSHDQEYDGEDENESVNSQRSGRSRSSTGPRIEHQVDNERGVVNMHEDNVIADDDHSTNSRNSLIREHSSGQQEETITTDTALATPVNELYKQRRDKLRTYYSDGNFFGSPISFVAYRVSLQLRFGNYQKNSNNSDLLWLACVGVTDAYLHSRLDVSGYTELALELKRCILKQFPMNNESNTAFHRASNATYAEQLSISNNNRSTNNGTKDLTRITFSENSKIIADKDYKFFLLRHVSLYDSMIYSNYISTKFQLWTHGGIQKLRELLAKMGYPLEQCTQPFIYMKPSLRRQLHASITEYADEFGLENFEFTSFFRVTGYQSLISASDTSYAISALLECDTVNSDTSTLTAPSENSVNEDEEGRNERIFKNMERLEMQQQEQLIESFNIAYDALNPNGNMSTSNGGTFNGIIGDVEGNNMSNLVNAGKSGSGTGISAGIRLAVSLQRAIITMAVSLIERNAITRLRHFRYAYITCTSEGENYASSSYGQNGNDRSKNKFHNRKSDDKKNKEKEHIFSKPLILTRLAHYLMDVHRENGKWINDKSRPLLLVAEKPATQTFIVTGYEYPEKTGYFTKNRFSKNFELCANTLGESCYFKFDTYIDTNVIEISNEYVQRFLEQLHYLMETI